MLTGCQSKKLLQPLQYDPLLYAANKQENLKIYGKEQGSTVALKNKYHSANQNATEIK